MKTTNHLLCTLLLGSATALQVQFPEWHMNLHNPPASFFDLKQQAEEYFGNSRVFLNIAQNTIA